MSRCRRSINAKRIFSTKVDLDQLGSKKKNKPRGPLSVDLGSVENFKSSKKKKKKKILQEFEIGAIVIDKETNKKGMCLELNSFKDKYEVIFFENESEGVFVDRTHLSLAPV